MKNRDRKILVVDDSKNTLELLKRNLTAKDYSVFTASGVDKAIDILKSTHVDLVITDLKMPKASGLDLIRYVKENLKDTNIMMITGYATVGGAVEAVKAGAEEYLSKPFTEEELFSAVDKAFEKLYRKRLTKDTDRIDETSHHNLIGNSKAMKRVYGLITNAAKTDANVLITGESGSGKELIARAIHYASNRAKSPFVPVNCGGIPEGLLESELFGHVKGAFTGANESRAGFFQTADGGTIFLDEISETPVSMQVKLLRVLQDKNVYMVGNTKSRKVDVRIVAATNKNLNALVKKNIFREDLFYRLNVFNIDVPALRERNDDIILLINYFSRKYCREMGLKELVFSDDALKAISKYSWPGNVRELENLMQRLSVMSVNRNIEVSDLPSHMRFSGPKQNGFDRTLEEVEQDYIKNVLISVKNNKTKAAKILGIDRKTLREKLKKNGE